MDEHAAQSGSIDPATADAARARLAEERERVTELITSTGAEFADDETGSVGALSSADQHPADLGSETFEREKDLSILESLEAELAEIEAALARIDEGTYGVDERTGEPIDPARLDAMPTARTNVDPHDA